MGKAERGRWRDNLKAMEIVAKSNDEITQEDIDFLRDNYTGAGGLLPKFMNLGQFFTPPHVAKFIVQALKIPPGARILEPSCGAGAFIEHLPTDCEITGIELDETSARVTQLIYPNANIITGNAFNHSRRDYYDFVIGNPPFGENVEVNGDIGFETMRYDKREGVSRGKSEFAFIELAIRTAKPGAYIAFILPMNIGFADQAAAVRKLMRETCWHVATIKLPPETFQHVGTSVSIQILIMRKVTPNARLIKSSRIDAEFYEGQQPIFMASVQDIGWDKKGRLTDKWGDGLTQLDELLEPFIDDYLIRENLYPHNPSWIHAGKDVTYAPFWNEDCDGYKDAKRYFRPDQAKKALLWWNEMTLGVGEGRSWDFNWQDEIVSEYYRSAEIEVAA